MIRNAALLSIILLAAPVVTAAEPPNPMATPTPTPGPKINTDLKVAPGILLGAPKPAACPGAKSTDILVSSCSGAPGTHLTLATTLGKNVTEVQVLFKQNAGSKMTNYSATVGRSAGAYTVTVPPLCNGGNPSFNLVASYIPLVLGRGSVSENLGNFTAICVQPAATASPKPTSAPTQVATGASATTVCPGAPAGGTWFFSSCSGAPGTQVTLTNSPPLWMTVPAPHLEFNSGYGILALSSGGRGSYTFIVPPICNGGSNTSFSFAISYRAIGPNGVTPYNAIANVGNFTVICVQPAATASPKPTPTANPKPKPTATHHDN